MTIIKDTSGNGIGAEIGNPNLNKEHEFSGNGSPEGNITAGVGSVYRRMDGGAGTSLYVKESGTGNTGWIGK